MYNEFNQHKKSDTIKWIVAFSLIIVLMAGVIASLVIAIGKKPSEDMPVEQPEVVSMATEDTPVVALSVGQARLMSAPVKAAATEAQYVSQTVTATITPATVVDKYVTWSLAWASDAPLKDKNISDYIKITNDSQGNLTATLNCYKSFRGSKAILTCTTRQGGKTATVNVVYDGAPSSMVVNSPSGVTKYNLGKDSVDFLYVGKTYSLNLALDNIFHDVGSNFNDYVVTVSGVGTVQCGKYSASPRGAYWYSDYNTIDFSTIAKEFVTTSTTGNTLSINVTKSLYDYYESKSSSQQEMIGLVTVYTNKLKSLNTDSDGNLPYFVLTVKHKTLGFSAQYKFFIGESVNSVSTSKTTISF